MLHHELRGKQGLWSAETPERPIGWRIRGDRPGANSHVRTRIRTPCVDRRPRQDDRGQGAVSPPIEHDLDVLSDKSSILVDRRSMRDDTWMTLGRRGKILVPVVGQP